MTKNVNVVDELGKGYVPTYAKRAKGLVKNGRARWLDENTICLACPPDMMNLEDAEMENKINSLENIPVESTNENNSEVQVAWLLQRIDRIIEQGDALTDVVRKIQAIPVNEAPDGGSDGANRAKAIGDIYRAREATNQKMLDILMKLYEDAKPQKDDFVAALSKFDWVGVLPETAKAILDAINWKTIEK